VIQQNNPEKFKSIPEQTCWLRYEPFILHVMCRSLSAAQELMTAARPAFKNVGLTSWKHGFGRYIVAIWGDEGVDMPLTAPSNTMEFLFKGQEEWLKDLINQRHYRNWKKIERFVGAVRAMTEVIDQMGDDWVQNDAEFGQSTAMETDMVLASQRKQDANSAIAAPKRFDVVGDIALVHPNSKSETDQDMEEIGNAIMKRNKSIKVVAVRSNVLSGTERAPGEEGTRIIAGAQRSPLVTSHMEYGIKCVVDLNHCFFSTRMGPERLRICQQVARGENILALFCGVGMDAMQIAGRTEATVLAVELNPVAYQCAQRGHRMLSKNKTVKCQGAADRLKFVQGDALEIMSQLEHKSFDRILAPRPKEGNMDGDLGTDGGVEFLKALLPLMKHQGECHWYDFAADWELPQCDRTRKTIDGVCKELGLEMEVIHVAKVGSIAKRQMRVCMDFRVIVKEQR
jgi:tRNA G37 N-methylase Trm5